MNTNSSQFRSLRHAAVCLIAAATLLMPVPMANAGPSIRTGWDEARWFSVIELDGATGAEGIAAGEDTTFYAGDRLNGDIYKGDLGDDDAELHIDAPTGRAALGMKVDRHHDLLFVAGGATGQAYVYDLDTQKPLADYQLATGTADDPAFINDVTLTSEGAWFTNSRQGVLYFVPIDKDGDLGELRKLLLLGPAGNSSSAFNLNGIAAVQGGKVLVVAHTGLGELYTVNPETGASALIAGVSVPNVDGILTKGKTLWAVQNMLNQVSRISLDNDLSSGTIREVIKSPSFDIPTTAALIDGKLAVINAKFTTPDATTFEAVVVDARGKDH